jgi:hypothetical protein
LIEKLKVNDADMYVHPHYKSFKKAELCLSCSLKKTCNKYKDVEKYCKDNGLASAFIGCANFKSFKYSTKMILWPASFFDGDTSIEIAYNTDDYTVLDADVLLSLGDFMSCKYFFKREVETLDGKSIKSDESTIDVDIEMKTIDGVKMLVI